MYKFLGDRQQVEKFKPIRKKKIEAQLEKSSSKQKFMRELVKRFMLVTDHRSFHELFWFEQEIKKLMEKCTETIVHRYPAAQLTNFDAHLTAYS